MLSREARSASHKRQAADQAKHSRAGLVTKVQQKSLWQRTLGFTWLIGSSIEAGGCGCFCMLTLYPELVSCLLPARESVCSVCYVVNCEPSIETLRVD